MAKANEGIVEKLRKVLALTTSPNEGEAQLAAERLQTMLARHNLSMADLERKGGNKPKVGEGAHDLGKAAFTWKLDLAEAVADHYYCFGLVDRRAKTVVFVGRPDNVESLKVLYSWLIDQVKIISRDTRREHLKDTGEHVDPLRWQVNFGVGAVKRLRRKLSDLRADQARRQECDALVLHHKTEISDYLEKEYGYRDDGQATQYEKDRDARWAESSAKWKAQREADEELLKTDPEAYYRKYPHKHPDVMAADAKRWAKEAEQDRKREERNAKRRKGRAYREESQATITKREQARTATDAGYEAGGRVNLQPFVEGGVDGTEQVTD